MLSSSKQLFATALLLFSVAVVVRGADEYPELPRFQQVTERLFRGGQPGQGGIPRLAGLGINTIINLRGAGSRTRSDEAEARSWGLNYFNVALPVWGRPDDAAVRRIMELVAAPENGHVFIHCKDGVDRTGMITALYRISVEGWSTESAIAEAVHSGMRRHQYWMRDYISDYALRQQPHAVAPDDDMKDRIGVGVRVGERATFRAQKTAIRVLRKTPGAVHGFFGKVF